MPATPGSDALDLLFFHGLESGPRGRKVQAFEAAGHRVRSPDMRGLDLAARLPVATAALDEACAAVGRPPIVVGSSYGGITAVLVAMAVAARATPLRLPGLVLAAAALELPEPPVLAIGVERLDAGCPTILVHGLRDDVVPIAWSRRYAARTGSALWEVDDDHGLGSSVEVLLRACRAFTDAGAPEPG